MKTPEGAVNVNVWPSWTFPAAVPNVGIKLGVTVTVPVTALAVAFVAVNEGIVP